MGIDLGSNSAATTKQRAVAKSTPADSAAAEPKVKPSPPKQSIVSVITGDASLLMAASGICTMVVSGIVSIAMVALDDNLSSANAAPGEVVLPPGHPPISPEKLAEMVELDENGNPKKRISRCPLGF
ncbi:hypothetical protein AM587_10016672 [Phytophthora nicotianae]|uniref:Uncharacterized protein n=1 Tax=Phytophthora nicotianae TaxID=4792 RepID=A0A0W8DVL0_PHYNI|nr:hypothetical protein AM587_10016672 [Phytophthora nicotianae]